jgi:hypothetical protein
MLSLYFNCRITEQQLTPDIVNSGWFYPITYPKSIRNERLSQYKILIKTIESYSKINFDVAVFNIEIDYISDEIKREIKDLIINNYSANKFLINFTRPSTINEWIKNVSETQLHIKKDTAVLVVMNHDHPFIDYTTNTFTKIVENVFKENEINYGKALYYSHAPEVISWAMNGHGDTKFSKQSDGIFKSDVVNNWLDCICIMTLETLQNIWKQAKYEGVYIGRFDWRGVSYSRLGITIYVFPREFFKHFDGYGHVTGIRLISEFDLNKSHNLFFVENENINELCYFYYQRWLDCFVISVRDMIKTRNKLIESKKTSFINAIEESLKLFKYGYLEADVASGLLNEKYCNEIEAKLRSHVYYMGNSLNITINSEIDLLDEIEKRDKISLLKKYMPKSVKKIMKIIIKLFKNGEKK